jgi:serine/threonine protein kinase
MNNPGMHAPGGASKSDPSLAAGKSVGSGRFLLKKVLGQGGMGVVWLAHDMRLREFTALKFLPPEVASDPSAVDDLRKETLRSRKLSHPNIVRIHDLWETTGEPTFIAMEYVDGLNLHYCRANRPAQVLPWKFLMPLLRQLCEALDYAHGERVLHRDLKPANVMLDGNGRLKLADFGLACVIHDSSTRSSGIAQTRGTLSFMSPQQADGEKPSVTDDIYSLGATIYDLMTSQPPFYTGDIGYQLRHNRPQHMHERLADLELSNDIPSEVSAMVMACLAKEPDKRPQSARAILEWLDCTDFSKPSAPAFVPEPISNPVPAPVASVIPAAPEPRIEPVKEPPAAPILASQPLVAAPEVVPSPVESIVTDIPQEPVPLAAMPGKSSKAGKWALISALVVLFLVVQVWLFFYLRGTKPPTPAASPVSPQSASAAVSEEGFESLFSGTDLSGWKGDELFWSVKDGAITGQFTPNTGLKRGTFLVWEGGKVDDFELRLSFRGQGNGGVKYRGVADEQGKIAGYIAPLWLRRTGDLLYTGPSLASRGIARGNGNSALRSGGEWNDYVIIAQGRHFLHQINGVTVLDTTDTDSGRFSNSGLLALELSAGPKEKAFALQFKNIRLKRLETSSPEPAAPSGFTSLFNGNDLTGWTGNPGIWSVKNGIITGEANKDLMPARSSTFLVWDGVADDFEFTCRFRTHDLGTGGTGNSGVQYRAKRTQTFNLSGYQFEIGSGATGRWMHSLGQGQEANRVSKYGSRLVYPRGSAAASGLPAILADGSVIRDSLRDGDWNDLKITARGSHLVHQVNGYVTADIIDEDPVLSQNSGVLGLEVYYLRGSNFKVEFKDLFLKRLK